MTNDMLAQVRGRDSIDETLSGYPEYFEQTAVDRHELLKHVDAQAAEIKRLRYGGPHEVRFDPPEMKAKGADTIDEVVGCGEYHLEMMDNDWMCVHLGPDMFAIRARGRMRFTLTEKNSHV